MRDNKRNLIWNPKGENQEYYFNYIQTEKNIGIVCGGDKELYAVDIIEEKKKLSFAQPCLYTDNFYSFPKWFHHEFYGENHITVKGKKYFDPKTKRPYATLGEMLKRIKKLEHLFPENTELILSNMQYGTREDNSTFGFNLKYITKRKFKGYVENFNVSKPQYFDSFQNDLLQALLIDFLRENNFLAFVEDVDYRYDEESKNSKCALISGYGLRVGISECNNGYYGYYDGRENILYDKENEFDKWSKCYQIKKPTSTDEFQEILKTLIEHSKKED